MHKFTRVLFSVLCLAGASQAFSGPQTYYLLAPESFTGDIKVVSLEPANTITVGNYQLTLDQYQRASIPNSVLYSGVAISGTRSFSLGSDPDATDLLVPSQFAGTSFAIPHISGQHRYYLMTTAPGGANATLTVGASTTNVTLTANTVIEVDGGSNNALAARITASANIYVAHVGVVSGAVRDAFPVPPAASSVVGIRSQNVTLAASANSTSVTVYASDGTTSAYNLNAGEQVAVTTGTNSAQGQGSALRIDASNPVMAVQHDDGDGNDATAFWPVSLHTRRLAIPVDAQYLAVACTSASVSVTLYRGATAPDSQTCSGSATNPGKVFFGSATNGANIPAGWYVIASADVYAAYEAATPNDEHNLLGVTLAAGPAAPALTAPAATTTSNPLAISGTAAANAPIRVFVNNRLVATGTASGAGTFSINTPLVDGANVIYATALTGSDESAPSNVVSTAYTNSIARTQSGTIAVDTVWTPGSPATPYVISANLTVAAGTQLTLQPGATLKFANGVILASNGTLSIKGEPGNPVTLTCNAVTCTKGIWAGIDALAATSNVVIENATIEWAASAVEIGGGGTATIRNNTIRNFSSDGLFLKNVTASTLVANNLIDNLNDQAECIEVNNASPTITGNTLQNCAIGIYVFLASSPTVNGNNVITSNQYGLQVAGNVSQNPQPVVTGNQIYGNSQFDYYTFNFQNATTLVLNATGNWWGTTDLRSISNKIYDLTDNYTNPTNYPAVSFASPLNGPNGTAIAGNYLLGALTAASTTLTAGAAYQVIGVLFVPATKTLTIPAGAQLRFHDPAARLVVDGTLSIQGTAAAKVILSSGRSAPVAGDWPGILIRSTASGVVIDNAVIEHANRAVDAVSANAIVRNSVIRLFADDGIRMTNATSASQISNNYFDNLTRIRECIYLTASSPSITGNRIHRCEIGIYMEGASSPAVTGNIIQDNNRGIYLYGNSSNSAAAVPNPTITANDLFGNLSSQLEVANYGASNPVVINATGNWWGTATPAAGQQIKFVGGSPTTSVNFSGAASGPLNGTVSGVVTVSEPHFSPNNDGVKESTLLQSTLTQSASWTLNILGAGGSVVRTYSGSGTSISATWDGRNGSNQLQPDGVYGVEVTVPGPVDPRTIGQQAVSLDVTPPNTAISAPGSGAVLVNAFVVAVTGTSTDTNFLNYVLEYGVGASPSTWTQVATQTTAVQNNSLGNWTVNSIDGSAGISGLHTLRVRGADRAGNTANFSIPVTIDNITAGAITQSAAIIRPAQGEQLSVNFTMSLPGTATLDIYPDLGGPLVRSISQTFASAGAKSLAWNGRDLTNNVVADEAYRWVLTLTDGTRTTLYDPPDTNNVGSGSGTVDAAINIHANDFWKMDYMLSDAKARVRMQVSGCVTGTIYPYDWVPFAQGNTPLIWNGRDAAGNPAVGSCSVYFDPPDPLRPFSVIVKGSSPAITGTRASPNLEVDGQPYVAFHSYDQIGRFTYRLSLDSIVTVKLLPPGVTDFNSPSAIVVTNAATQPALSGGTPVDYSFEWKGYDSIDTNNILVSAEGSYTVAIQATSTLTGRTTLYRGVLQLYQ